MKKLVGILILVLFATFTGWRLWINYKMENNVEVNNIAYRDYENPKAGYKVRIPAGWYVAEASDEGRFVARTVFKRTVDHLVGSIGEISITAVASSSAAQPFSRRSEFMEWREKPDESATGTGIIKLKNEEVAGSAAVRIAEVDMVLENINQSWWSVTTWFIKGNVNYYINMMGNGALTGAELLPFDKVLNSFQFTP